MLKIFDQYKGLSREYLYPFYWPNCPSNGHFYLANDDLNPVCKIWL